MDKEMSLHDIYIASLFNSGGGVDTSDATATAEDIAAGKTAYANSEKLIGTLVQNVEFAEGTTDFTGTSGLSGFFAAISKVNIPDGTTSIGDYAFYNCTRLSSITIPDSVTGIGDFAFEGCTSLASITIPVSVTSIGYKAFYDCSSLESITIPNSVTRIGDFAFKGCTSLKSIIIPDSMTRIGASAFEGCTSLSSITIPDSVTSIGNYALSNTNKLADIYYTGTEEQWNAINKRSDWNQNMGSNVSGGTVIHYNYVQG